MKGEYVEHHHHHHPNNETPPNMFSTHQQPQQHQHHPCSHHPIRHSAFPHHCLASTLVRNPCQQVPPEDENRRSGAAAAPNTAQKPNSSGGDGATIEVVRRPRGRPPGSKNKPKPPVIITSEPEPAMSPYILEVSVGNDVVETIARFSRRKNMGLCVLKGSGTVANVTLRQRSPTPGKTVTFHGHFEILSISATFLPQPSPPIPNGFTISFAGPQGQIVGGDVVGRLMAAGTVFVIAASFNNPSYHRLPPEEEEARNSVYGGDNHHLVN